MANGTVDELAANAGEDGDKAAPAVKSAHQLRVDGLKEQIELLTKEMELQELEKKRELLERERAEERARETPEAQAREKLALAKQRAKEEREEQRELEKLAREDREAVAAQVSKQLDKTRIGKLKLRDAPAGFEPTKLRDFSKKRTSIYEFGGADLGGQADADYFSLSEEQAQDLYERIGANRGVVFDPSQDNVFHLGFRPVLRGPATESALEDELREGLGQLTEKLSRLEAEQMLLDQEIAHWASPREGKSAYAAISELLRDATMRKEKLEAALGTAVNGGQSRYESILQDRIKRIETEDEEIEIKLPSNGSASPATSARSEALQASRSHREDLVAKIDQLEKQVQGMKYGPSRAPLLAYVQGIRAKVSKVEKLERRLGQQADRDAFESLLYLLQKKRSVLEVRLEAAWKEEKLAAARAEATGKKQAVSQAQQATQATGNALTELDRQWVTIETKLRTEAPEPQDGRDGVIELRAAVESALEDQIDEQVKKRQKEIRSLSEEWIDALDKLLPEPGKDDEAASGPDSRIVKALDAIEERRTALKKELEDVKGAPQIDQVRALREDLAALEREWQKALVDGAIKGHSSRDPVVARGEARAIVKRELQRLLRKATEARLSQSTEQENQLREHIRQAEAWCGQLSNAKQLSEVASDRRYLKHLEVQEARSKLDSVKTALGKILQARQNGGSGTATLPARIYFRKPDLDANFENKFTASETEAKAMSSGIDTTDFRVNSAFASAFVSAGAGWGRSTEESHMRGSASSSRKVYITSSFSLPKVELSLPLEYPCASDEFLAAVQGAMALASQTEKEKRLFRVLREFGHFVPRRITVGGKLYSTEERDLKASETASEVAKKHANEVQTSISVSTPWFGGGVEAKGAWGTSTMEQETQKSIHEAQSLILNAVGGEGGYVKDLGKWSESLQSYTRWQTINMADLSPSVNILPNDEKQACIGILREYVRLNQRVLASKRAARFLFYSGYAELVDLQPTYFYLRNLARGRVLSLSGGFDDAGVFAVTAEPVRTSKTTAGSVTGTGQVTDNGQLWTISPDGYLINQVRSDGVELALTLKEDKKTVVAVPPDPANESQIWHVGNRGPITGTVTKASDQVERPVLKADDTGKVGVELVRSSATLTSYHQWVVVSQEAMLRIARMARAVYRSKDQIIELALDYDGSWSFVPLTANLAAPKAKGRPFAYATGFDGVQRVLYVDESDDVQELWLPPERPWTHAALTSYTRAPKADGDPFGYVGGKTARALYRDKEGHVRELWLAAGGGGWHCADLTNKKVKAKGNAFGYVYDSKARVVFRDVSDDVWEFRLEQGGWQSWNLTDYIKVKATGDPIAYVTDSSARVVFKDKNGGLYELSCDAPSKWVGGALPSAAGADPADPFGFVGPDSKAQVLYRDKSNHIQLLSLRTKWETKDLTNDASAPEAIGRPVAFVTSDKITRVLYRDKSHHIQQLSLRPADTKWEKTDLTDVLKLSNWPADSDPTGYAV